ncbi:hypothetical protein N7510_003544 [Penicillium lagena]|uniref:uncharacterized protein n=1 Tax=Penicillium lagena TaxID=94218 RepID=UPI0025422282|nr:uncharacterized protein N7510_003544 [Penicillium lagena]KAJ5619560.1 hypothetical protein N7510_003544 [Penicillium lagena]
MSSRVLRIPRSDEPEAFVLVHVASSGSLPLDLTVIATEGESPYINTVKQAHLKNLRAKNYQGTDDEWFQIVSLALGQRPLPVDDSGWSSGVETTASISGSEDEGKELVITIRKRVQTITQRLGALTLTQDDEQAVELFDWSGIAAARAEGLEQQVADLTDRYRLAEDTIRKLNQQLEDLMHAKSQHENQMVGNFVQLLNEKKLKIRNQQRLLASATADPAKVSEIQAALADKPQIALERGHGAKRGAQDVSETDEDSDQFERMDVDQRRDTTGNQETDDDQPSTPQMLEEQTATDDEELDQLPSTERVLSAEGGRSTHAKRGSLPKKTLPPRRELPFTSRVGAPRTTTQLEQTNGDTEETAGETDDDEL